MQDVDMSREKFPLNEIETNRGLQYTSISESMASSERSPLIPRVHYNQPDVSIPSFYRATTITTHVKGVMSDNYRITTRTMKISQKNSKNIS